MNRFIRSTNELKSLYTSLDHSERVVVGTVISMIIGVICIAGKLIIGVFTGSAAFLYSCVYALGVAVCKLLYLRNEAQEENRQWRTYNVMCMIMMLYAVAFNFLMLIREETAYVPVKYSPIITVLFSLYWIYLYIVTVRAIKQAKKEDRPLLIELRMVNLSSLLMNLVLLQQMVLSCLSISTETVRTINTIFGYFCGGAMFLISLSMMIYGLRKKRKE